MPNRKPITRYSVWYFGFDFAPMWSICGPFSFRTAVAYANELRKHYPLVKVVAVRD